MNNTINCDREEKSNKMVSFSDDIQELPPDSDTIKMNENEISDFRAVRNNTPAVPVPVAYMYPDMYMYQAPVKFRSKDNTISRSKAAAKVARELKMLTVESDTTEDTSYP